MFRAARISTLLGFALSILFTACDSSSGSGGSPGPTNPDPQVSNSPVLGTWSLGTTGVLQILSFRADGTYSETYCDSTQTPRWIRKTGTWTATDTSVTTTATRTDFGSDTLHLAGANSTEAAVTRQFTLSGSVLILSTTSGGTRVSLKYVSGTSGVLPPAITVAAPAFSVPGGTYATAQTVALSTSTSGATILYSLDGSNPLTVYTAPVVVAASATLRAVAILDGSFSTISSATYAISGTSTSGNHDPSLVGTWWQVYHEPVDESGYSYYDTSTIALSSDGVFRAWNHSLVIPPSGSPFDEEPDSTVGTWSTNGDQLTTVLPADHGGGGTGTFVVTGTRLILRDPNGELDTLNRR